MSSVFWLLASLLFLAKAGLIWAHGRLIDPPSRSSMWRFDFKTPKNYNDNELYCGGYRALWIRNHGKCGVCGDPYDETRDNEAGGKYATGQIVSHYVRGQDFLVTVELTVNHGGYFVFDLCPVNRPDVKAAQSCFARFPLLMTNGQEKYVLPNRKAQHFHIPLRLPPELSCRQCVFRWKYVTATSWGCGRNRCCVGCGRQEQFYGCADISITTPSIISRTTPKIPDRPKCRAKIPWRTHPSATPWCIRVCARNCCNSYYCEESCFKTKMLQSPCLISPRSKKNTFWDNIFGGSNETIKTITYKGHLIGG